MKKIQYVLIVFMLALPFSVSAASFTLIPSSGNFATGNTFTSIVYVTPNAGETITAAQLSINFPASNLEVISFIPVSGLLAPVVPSIDNTAGTLSYTAAFLPGITTQKMFGTITFKTKANGQAQITMATDSKLLDPTSTDKNITGISAASFTVATPTPIVVPEPVTTDEQEVASVVTSAPSVTPSADVISAADNTDEKLSTTDTQTGELVTSTLDAQLAAAAGADTGSGSGFYWYYILAGVALLLLLGAAWRKWGDKIKKIKDTNLNSEE